MITMQTQVQLQPLTGLLAGLVPGPLLSWGPMEVIVLFPADPAREERHAHFVPPLQSVELLGVRRYGTLELRNLATNGVLLLPMHIAFFQPGAQNHATSRVLILEPGKTLIVDDCFCVQQSQGGFLARAQQRFLILPLSLRRAALELQGLRDFSRLWKEIATYTSRFGIKQGGHLERWLRPNFARLLPYRHAFELLPGQVGAVYFLAGAPVGVEVAPNSRYWAELLPVLTIYCYAPAALLASYQGVSRPHLPLDLEGLRDLDDLQSRLLTIRRQELAQRLEQLVPLASLEQKGRFTKQPAGLRLLDLKQSDWLGQAVYAGTEMVYLSLFRSEL
jgi:hypothetical protein